MSDKIAITVETLINAPLDRVWDFWTGPEHIMQWNSASDDWHTPTATNDLREGGTFASRMETKDGSVGFDFGGTYSKVVPNEHIAYTMGDGRKVTVQFKQQDGGVLVTETFEAEGQNPVEMQRGGWQSILDNFKKYTEKNA